MESKGFRRGLTGAWVNSEETTAGVD